jgi:hypothetical protein
MVPEAVRKGYAFVQNYLAKQVEVRDTFHAQSIFTVYVVFSCESLLPEVKILLPSTFCPGRS